LAGFGELAIQGIEKLMNLAGHLGRSPSLEIERVSSADFTISASSRGKCAAAKRLVQRPFLVQLIQPNGQVRRDKKSGIVDDAIKMLLWEAGAGKHIMSFRGT
jgi:hypothetical protein